MSDKIKCSDCVYAKNVIKQSIDILFIHEFLHQYEPLLKRLIREEFGVENPPFHFDKTEDVKYTIKVMD